MYEDENKQSITTVNNEVLDNGVEYAHNQYKEEVEKYDLYNKRAKYPMSVITFLVTAVSLFIEQTDFLVDHHLLSLIIIALIFVIIICFVAITIPYYFKKAAVPEDEEFYEKINDPDATLFKKWLIDSYRTDAKTYRKFNRFRGWLLLAMNICLAIIVIAIIVALLSSIFPDFSYTTSTTITTLKN